MEEHVHLDDGNKEKPYVCPICFLRVSAMEYERRVVKVLNGKGVGLVK